MKTIKNYYWISSHTDMLNKLDDYSGSDQLKNCIEDATQSMDVNDEIIVYEITTKPIKIITKKAVVKNV